MSNIVYVLFSRRLSLERRERNNFIPGYEVKIVIAIERKEKVRSFDYRCQLPVKPDRPSPATFQDGVKGRGFPMYRAMQVTKRASHFPKV